MAAEGLADSMPSLFRFLFIVAMLGSLVLGVLYVLSTTYEPQPQTISTPLPGGNIRR